MFKKGQVWRTPKGSLFRVITFLEDKNLIFVKFIYGPTRGRMGWADAAANAKVCRHIGNNYRNIRTKEPDRPGAAFRRWLDEQTSGLPDQRGCRKEDC